MEENNINKAVPENTEYKENTILHEEKATNPAHKGGKNNLIPILAIVLSVVAIILCVINLCNKQTPNNIMANNKFVKTIQTGELKIAYVNTDSILAKYDMALEMQKTLDAKQKQAENSFKQAQALLEKDYNDFMANGDKLTLTQQKAKEKDLQQRMQSLQQMPAKLQSDLQQEQLAQNKKLLDAVYAFVKDYNAKHDKYNIILSKSYTNSPTLYMDEGMDITQEIIKGLNEEYKEYKKK